MESENNIQIIIYLAHTEAQTISHALKIIKLISEIRSKNSTRLCFNPKGLQHRKHISLVNPFTYILGGIISFGFLKGNSWEYLHWDIDRDNQN